MARTNLSPRLAPQRALAWARFFSKTALIWRKRAGVLDFKRLPITRPSRRCSSLPSSGVSLTLRPLTILVPALSEESRPTTRQYLPETTKVVGVVGWAGAGAGAGSLGGLRDQRIGTSEDEGIREIAGEAEVLRCSQGNLSSFSTTSTGALPTADSAASAA